MKETKTRKLICNITGRVLFTGMDYYLKKVKKAGTEEILHNTYMCREAITLLKKGYSIEDTQSTLDVTSFKSKITDEEVKKLISGTSMRLNNSNQVTVGVVKTDPDVKALINNILNDE